MLQYFAYPKKFKRIRVRIWRILLIFFGFLLIELGVTPSHAAQAAYQQRASLGAGIISMKDPDDTAFLFKGQYEYHLNSTLGTGGTVDYIFSDPNIFLISLPEVFWHPLESEWFINGGLLFKFRSGKNTQMGVRLGTRVPIPLGRVTFVPLLVMDFIGGNQYTTIGLGLEF